MIFEQLDIPIENLEFSI